jgi:hypothetical protein
MPSTLTHANRHGNEIGDTIADYVDSDSDSDDETYETNEDSDEDDDGDDNGVDNDSQSTELDEHSDGESSADSEEDDDDDDDDHAHDRQQQQQPDPPIIFENPGVHEAPLACGNQGVENELPANDQEFVTAQMLAKAGLQMFGAQGANALMKELKELTVMNVMAGYDPCALTCTQKEKSLKYLIYLKENLVVESRDVAAPMGENSASTRPRQTPAHRQ